MLVVFIGNNRCSPVIEVPDHLAFVERYPIPSRAPKAVAADRIGPFLFLQFLPGDEQAGVIRHVEHGRIANRPCLDLRTGRAIDQNGQTAIDRRRQSRVAPCAKNRRGASVRIDAREICRSQRNTPIGIRSSDTFSRKNAQRAGLEIGDGLAMKAQNLNRVMHIRKEQLRRSARLFSKS